MYKTVRDIIRIIDKDSGLENNTSNKFERHMFLKIYIESENRR